MYPSLCSPLDTKIWAGIRINTCVSVETLRRALTQLQKTLDEKLSQTGSFTDSYFTMNGLVNQQLQNDQTS